MNLGGTIFVAGHRGMVGSAIVRRLQALGHTNILTASKPDGTPRKLMDVSRLAALGWRARFGLEDGLRDGYQWFVARPKCPFQALECP